MQTFLNILHAAIDAGASDIHLKPGAPVVFRIARDLVPVDAPVPTEEWLNSILEQIVPPHLQARLTDEREADFAYAPAGFGRFRVNVFQQRGVFVVSMRLVKATIRDFAQLNLPAVVQRVTEAPRGIVVIAGATGSGKSTTLAAMVEHINHFARRHIITLEDPIEYLFTDKQSVIEQREVGLDTASFSSGLRNVLRQDPDVLVIGEMRDASSISAAISAANIGHLVISTLHTSDAAKSVQRILDFFPASDRDQARRQLASTLHAVICQKLIPSPTDTLVPAVEVMINTASVTKLIHSDQLDKLAGVIEMGGAEGMQTFEMALHDLAKAGRISTADALLHAPNAEALKMRFQGVVLSEHRRILGSRE